MTTKRKVNFLNNVDILKQIHLSKITYCSKPEKLEYTDYDIIVNDISEIFNEENLDLAKANRKKRTGQDINSLEELVFRVMNDEHIPEAREDETRRRGKKTKTNFPPFKHYIIENNEPKEVLRSHWKGKIEDGYFSIDHGTLTNNLCKMILMLAAKYATRPNFRSYSYIDEMEANAIFQMTKNALMFNESKSSNAFAYYTQFMYTCFIREIDLEKKNQTIRDDLLIAAGQMPSMTRQIDDEFKTKRDNDGNDLGVNESSLSKKTKKKVKS